jgi:transposase
MVDRVAFTGDGNPNVFGTLLVGREVTVRDTRTSHVHFGLVVVSEGGTVAHNSARGDCAAISISDQGTGLTRDVVVVDVPATLAARSRVLGSTRSNKTDPNDARSVALTALRHTELREVLPVGHGEVLRLLAKRNIDIGDRRTQIVCRLHALLVELAPGGIAKEINASDVDRFLARLSPVTPVEQIRYDLAVELLGDIRHLDEQPKTSHKRIRAAVVGSGSTVTELFGIGPVIAAMPICYTGDIGRFANRDHYAAYNGTAPVEFSSGGRIVHRLSQRGNRHLNHALHLAAICQMRHPHSEGRAYLDGKVADGKTEREAIRALKRQISNAVYRQLVIDARR